VKEIIAIVTSICSFKGDKVEHLISNPLNFCDKANNQNSSKYNLNSITFSFYLGALKKNKTNSFVV